MTRGVLREVTKEEEDWIRDNLRYDPETGHLWWLVQKNNRIMEKPAGYSDKDSYPRVDIRINGVRSQPTKHRLAWFLYYGVWPKDQVDHINNIKDDNRIVNLREATVSENQANQKIQVGGSSKYKGVHWKKARNKWGTSITVNYKLIWLGYYHNEEDAALAYNKAALEHFGEFAKINIIEPLDTSVTNTYISSSSGELTC